MKVIDPGHVYEPESIDGEYHQVITFVKREGDKWPGNVGHHAGTTTQELCRICLDRLRYVFKQCPCWETKACIYLFETIIGLLECRAARVHKRWLERRTLEEIDLEEMCSVCGHLQCPGHSNEEVFALLENEPPEARTVGDAMTEFTRDHMHRGHAIHDAVKNVIIPPKEHFDE